MREDYLKHSRINACLDDVCAKTAHIKVVCNGGVLSVLAHKHGKLSLPHFCKAVECHH